MRGAVVDMQSARAAANVHAKRFPGKSRLENALTQVAGKEQTIGLMTAEGRQKA
ncbi:hypothetical protein D3C86_1997870 [compost metagenome]